MSTASKTHLELAEIAQKLHKFPEISQISSRKILANINSHQITFNSRELHKIQVLVVSQMPVATLWPISITSRDFK